MPQTAAIQPTSTKPTRKKPPRSKRERLAMLDRRTKLARFIRELRADLVRHVGGSPSVTEAELINMAVDTAVEIEAMKQRRAENGSLSLHDHKAFLAYQNTLRLTLAQLGMKGASAKPPSLADIIAAHDKAAAR